MTRINQLKMPLGHDKAGLSEEAVRVPHVPSGEIEKLTIVKQPTDARKKPDTWYSYVMDIGIRQAGLQKEEKLARRLKNRGAAAREEASCQPFEPSTEYMADRPVIIGTGLAGLLCGLMLTREGYMPILLERGEDVDTRTDQVAWFWETGQLNPSSNVQLGEGGAGAFSDGKPSALVRDTLGRSREVLRVLAELDGDSPILYVDKLRIGTDVLSHIVELMRTEIEESGGRVFFQDQVTDLVTGGEPGESRYIEALIVNGSQVLEAEIVVLAIGHSARDTFETLLAREVPMEPRAFTAGPRVQHLQTLINKSQYSMRERGELGPTSYKPARKAFDERGVCSFCMRPGGHVVDASSEPGRLVVNGMSCYDRAGEDADGTIIVIATSEDSHGMKIGTGIDQGCEVLGDAMAGIRFQRCLEEAASRLGKGNTPVQFYGDFEEGRVPERFGGMNPTFKGGYASANLRELFPEPLPRVLVEGMKGFGTMIRGFDQPDAILAGTESRTSSPVRIPRDQGMGGPVKGIFPCGERAGYVGGITSAATDGIKTAEEIVRRYNPLRPPRIVAKA